MKKIKTYICNIFLGLKEGYNGIIHSIDDVENVLQVYCDLHGFAFTITPTKFIYTNGNEQGCIVGIINYPRFPNTEEKLKEISLEMGQILLERFKQQRLSIVCSDETIMLEAE